MHPLDMFLLQMRFMKNSIGARKMTRIIMREITKCTEEQKRAVREVRKQKSVRKSMYTEHEIPLNEHLDWME